MQEVLKMYGDAWAPESLPSFFRFLMDSQIAKGSGGRAGEWPPHWFVDPLQMHRVDERLLVEDHLAIVLKNNEYYDGVVFCRGLFDTAMEKVLLGTAHDALAGPGEDTKGATNSSVWHSKYDVSLPGPMAERWGKGVANLSTLAFPLKRNQRQSLYLPKLCSTDEITCWFQDENSNARKSLATGPEYQTVVKFTVTDKKVFFVIDSSEGVSGAIVTGYKDMEGNLQIAKMQPQNAPSGDELKVQKAPQYGFPTVLSSKHLVVEECNCPVQDHSKKCITDGCLAWCPDHFRLDACSMHNCRTWYAKTYANVSHYCGWLFSEKAQTLCWALDSIVCTDQKCGWGKSFEPVECHDIDPHARTQQATDYSCGYMTWTDDMRTEITKQTDVDHGPEELWWKDGPGCVDKYVDNQKMMPSARRNDGVFMIFFDSLAWLHVDDAGQKRKT
uniref:Uncharacterized protein n=1 Tax=Strombidinopsis acuminata TaxID=141414 RepID=A0A7S3X254_9SPIT